MKSSLLIGKSKINYLNYGKMIKSLSTKSTTNDKFSNHLQLHLWKAKGREISNIFTCTYDRFKWVS